MIIEFCYDNSFLPTAQRFMKMNAACSVNLDTTEVLMPRQIYNTHSVNERAKRMYDYVSKYYAGYKIIAV